jgi:predicted ABC-type ATPase
LAKRKRILIIAGPNGAGKTSFAEQYLSREEGVYDFINADMIARHFNPDHPERAALLAARLMLEMLDVLSQDGGSFAFETTLSGRRYANWIRRWRSENYLVRLVFLQLSSPQLAVDRVRLRVSEGGHDVPSPVVHRRFYSGLRNLEHVYKPLVDVWAIYDNSNESPALIDAGRRRPGARSEST